MVEATLLRSAPLAGIAQPRPANDSLGVAISERTGFAAAYLMVRAGAMAQFEAGLATEFGVETLPARSTPGLGMASLDDSKAEGCSSALAMRSRRIVAGHVSFSWAGPGRWLAIADDTAPVAWAARLAVVFAPCAAVSQQSDAQVIVRISGPKSREALAKLCPVDLHPRVFGADSVAVTKLGQVAVHLWRLGEGDAFELAIPRSYARHQYKMLLDASAEYR